MKFFKWLLALWLLGAVPALATISNTNYSVTYTGNNVQTAFTYGFLVPYQSDGSTPAVTVIVCTTATTTTCANVPKGGTSGYSISGVGVATGGTITYNPAGTPISPSQTLTITRSVNYVQPYAVGNTSFYPHTVEQSADWLELQIQQLTSAASGLSGVGALTPAGTIAPTGVNVPCAIAGTTTTLGCSPSVLFNSQGVVVSAYSVTPCTGAVDDTSALNTELAALGTAGGGVLYIPEGASCKVSSTLTVPANVVISGAGTGASTILAGATNLAPMIKLNGANSGVYDLAINAAYSGANTSGVTILYNNYTNIRSSNLYIAGPCIGVDINGVSDYLEDTTINNVAGSSCGGIRVGYLTTAANTIDPRITNVTVGGSSTTAGWGLEVLDAGGLIVTGSDMVLSTKGTVIVPGAGQEVDWATFNNTYMGDTNSQYGVFIQPNASTGIIKGLQCNNCWASSSGLSDVIVANANSGTVTGIHFVGLRAYNGTQNGVTISAGTNVTVDDSHICGNGTGYSSVYVASGVAKVGLRNNDIGGTCDSFATTPTYGIAFGGSNTGAIVAGNNLAGNGTALYTPPTDSASVIGTNIGAANTAVFSAPSFTVTSTQNPWVGTTSYTNDFRYWTAGSTTLPEIGKETIITSATGYANAFTAFKLADFNVANCSSGSANCYGGNDVVQGNSGFAALLTGREIDLNWNTGAMAGGPSTSTAGYNLTLAGTAASASYQATAAVYVTGVGANPVWQQGIYFGTGIKNNTIYDSGSALTSYLITGTHTTGMDTTYATLTNVINAAAGQRVCFNSNSVCLSYNSGAGKFYLTNASGVNIMSIESSTGNAKFLGTVTASTTP
jgi:hypothetical protein